MIERFPDKPIGSTPSILPMLHDGDYLAEFKHDGFRMLMHRVPAGWTFTSRHNKPLDVCQRIRDEVEQSLRHVPVWSVLDGEWLARRANVTAESIRVFDAMRWAENWQYQIGAWHRFCLVCDQVPPAWLPQWTLTGYGDFFEQSKQDPTTEGIVLKAKDSLFIGSVRGCQDNPLWLKVKWRAGCDGQTLVA